MKSSRQRLIYALVFFGAVLVTTGTALLLTSVNQRQSEARMSPLKVVEIPEGELDPAVWGQNFPVQYEMFMRTQENYGSTPYGGSEPYSKLDRFPAMIRLWAGYAFSIDHNEERGHYYMMTDQKNTQRVVIKDQPGACINCHSADAILLIDELGWEQFNHTPYNDLKDQLVHSSSCADCHNPETMELVITRPAFMNAMEVRGIDLSKATRQDMRTYVCAQCHVEYYFQGDNKILTFPWAEGLSIDNIETYYNSYGFKDWDHAESGAPMLKMQHPEYEMYSSGIHAQSGVACADCHMPYTRVGSVKISDHWLRSPLVNISASCQTCHNRDEKVLYETVVEIQNKTAELLRQSEEALLDAIDAIVAAKAGGATDEQLVTARDLHRSAQMRWDFVSSENSTGFHSPQEAARILADCLDFARQAQIAALLVTPVTVQTTVVEGMG